MTASTSPDLTGVLAAIERSPLRVHAVYAVGASVSDQQGYVAVLEERPDAAAVEAITALHHELRGELRGDGVHLSGVWAVRSDLASPMALGRRWWVVDADDDRPREDATPNTAARRWTLRSHGVAVLGPPATKVVATVTAEVLGAEALGLARTRGEAIEDEPALLEDLTARTLLVDELAVALHATQHGQVVGAEPARTWCRTSMPDHEAALGAHPGAADVRRFVWDVHARIGSIVSGSG